MENKTLTMTFDENGKPKKSKRYIDHLRTVAVLSMRGEYLTPCTPSKAASLIKKGKAKAVKHKVIQLLIPSGQNNKLKEKIIK